MNALELKKFIEELNIDWRWENNNGEEDVIIFPYDFQFEAFLKLVTPNSLDDHELVIIIKDGYFAVWMNDLCDYYNFDLEDVFKKK